MQIMNTRGEALGVGRARPDPVGLKVNQLDIVLYNAGSGPACLLFYFGVNLRLISFSPS